MRYRVHGQEGADRIRGKLAEAANRARPEKKSELLEDGGRYMVNTAVPLRFRAHGPGWPGVARGGSPLIDTGLLRSSNDYRIEGSTLIVGNTRPQARLMNRGGDVVPKNARFLAIPLSPPLSRTEARVKRPRDFAGAFVLMKGPEGPGIYRKTGTSARFGGSHGIERIFAFARKVHIKQRKFLYWGDALEVIKQRMKKRLMGRSVPSAGQGTAS